MADEDHVDTDTVTASEGATNLDFVATETFYADDVDGGVNDSRSAKTGVEVVTVSESWQLGDGVSELYRHPLYAVLVSSNRTVALTMDPLEVGPVVRGTGVDVVPM